MATKEVRVHMPNRDDKKRVVKFETDNPRETAVGNIYVSKEALDSIGNPEEIEVIIRPKS